MNTKHWTQTLPVIRIVLSLGYLVLGILYMAQSTNSGDGFFFAGGLFYVSIAAIWIFRDNLMLPEISLISALGIGATVITVGAALATLGGITVFSIALATSSVWLIVAVLLRAHYVRTHCGRS